MHRPIIAATIVLLLVASALSGCTTVPTATSEPDDTASVATPAGAILFDRYVDGRKQLFIVDADGGSERPLLREPIAGPVDVQHADWSPDGEHVVFEVLESIGETSTATVWIVDVGGANPKLVAGCSGDPCRQYAYPTWSPDGGRLAMVRFDLYDDGSCCESHLVVRTLDSEGSSNAWGSGEDEVLASFTAADAEALHRYDVYLAPTWSPDGGELAFAVEQYAFEDPYPLLASGVAVLPTAGGASRTVTPTDLLAGDPRWDRCSGLIAFTTSPLSSFQTTTQPSNVYTVRSDGTGLAQLTTASVDGSLRYGRAAPTPDGRAFSVTVARASDGETLDSVALAMLPTAGGEVRELGVSGAGPLVRPAIDVECAS